MADEVRLNLVDLMVITGVVKRKKNQSAEVKASCDLLVEGEYRRVVQFNIITFSEGSPVLFMYSYSNKNYVPKNRFSVPNHV